MPFFLRFSSAIKHSFNLVPKFNIATFFPSLIILPFPITSFSVISGKFIPTPIPLGYLNALGLSFISTVVLIILTSSPSSLAAITMKFGKVDR